MNRYDIHSWVPSVKVQALLRMLFVLILTVSLGALPPPVVVQAAPEAPQATTIIAALSDYGSGTPRANRRRHDRKLESSPDCDGR